MFCVSKVFGGRMFREKFFEPRAGALLLEIWQCYFPVGYVDTFLKGEEDGGINTPDISHLQPL